MKIRTTSRPRTTHNTASGAAAAVEYFMDGTMVVAGSAFSQARVLHHHPRRAADSMVYKSSNLITTSASVFP